MNILSIIIVIFLWALVISLICKCIYNIMLIIGIHGQNENQNENEIKNKNKNKNQDKIKKEKCEPRIIINPNNDILIGQAIC